METALPDDRSFSPAVDRRSAIRRLGALGGASIALSLPALRATAASLARTREGEIGPFFTDESDPRYHRRDLRSNLDGTGRQPGIPLALTIVVEDTAMHGAPAAEWQIDIWHCNAAGRYSNEASQDTAGQSWLRGYQITGRDGRATFHTIVPGWYEGRTAHVHARVGAVTHLAATSHHGADTTQFFFPQTAVDRIYKNVSPYARRGGEQTTNANDHVFTDQTKGENVLALAGDSRFGFAATVTIGVPFAPSRVGGPPGGPGGPPPGFGPGGPPPGGRGGPPPGSRPPFGGPPPGGMPSGTPPPR